MGVSRSRLAGVALALAFAPAIRGQAPPGLPDFAAQDEHLAELAVDAAAHPKVDPIPLLSGDRVVGAVYDRFLLGVVAARAAATSGQSATTASITSSPAWRSHQMMVVAYPLDCDGRPDEPLAIRYKPGVTIPVPIAEPPPAVRGSAAAALLPGVDLPADALVAPLALLPLMNAHFEVDYAAPVCHGAGTTASLAVALIPASAGRGVNGVKLPDSASAIPSPTTVRISALIDLDGRPRFMSQVQGPTELGQTAIAAIAAQQFAPQLVNGVPSPSWVWVPVVFTATGAPGAMAPPTLPPGGITSDGRVMTVTRPALVPTQPPASPPFPAALIEGNLERLAIEIGSAGPAAPISLDADGSSLHGILFDRFVMQVVQAHAAAAAGAPLNPLAPPPGFAGQTAVVVAVPINCGHPVAPTAIEMSASQNTVRAAGVALSGQALGAALPGVSLPDRALGQRFQTALIASDALVRITYAEPACPSTTNVVSLPLRVIPGQPISRPTNLKLPEGSTLPAPTTVHVRGVIDLTGAVRYLAVADGPAELEAAALTAAAQWHFLPFRANGTPVPQSVTLGLTFASPVRPSTGLAPTASSTVGGRSTEDATTADEPGLSPSTSKCAIAADAAYGFAAANPVKVGGDAWIGPSRERAYFAVLRGPAGQGLHFVRLGSTMGPDHQIILDMYEVTYAGLAQAVRVYVDEYHFEELKAPAGFLCAAPFSIK